MDSREAKVAWVIYRKAVNWTSVVVLVSFMVLTNNDCNNVVRLSHWPCLASFTLVSVTELGLFTLLNLVLVIAA